MRSFTSLTWRVASMSTEHVAHLEVGHPIGMQVHLAHRRHHRVEEIVRLELLDLLLEVEVREHRFGVLRIAVDVRAQVGRDVTRIAWQLVEPERGLVEERAARDTPKQQLDVLDSLATPQRAFRDDGVLRVLHRLVEAPHQRQRQDDVAVP